MQQLSRGPLFWIGLIRVHQLQRRPGHDIFGTRFLHRLCGRPSRRIIRPSGVRRLRSRQVQYRDRRHLLLQLCVGQVIGGQRHVLHRLPRGILRGQRQRLQSVRSWDLRRDLSLRQLHTLPSRHLRASHGCLELPKLRPRILLRRYGSLLVHCMRRRHLLRCCCGHSLNHLQQLPRRHLPGIGWRDELLELRRGPVLW